MIARAVPVAGFGPLPCEGRGGLGRGVFRISPNRGGPLPASPCRRMGKGQGKRSRLKPLLQESGAARARTDANHRIFAA
ncbi:hypothetical protein GCM10022229_16690 [Luteimonas lutimaris]|uniref:Uncharacterized protein n=1 Tax=Luteimonas lutimaris TaxID=698645 RepID=A0ABP7MLU5_9GAMM